MKQRRIHLGFASMLALALLAGSFAMMPARSAMAAFAYVVGGALSSGAPEIAVIDTNPTSPTFNTVIATIPNTSLATNLAITPDGSRGYVINDDGTVSVLDTNPTSPTFNTVLTTITPPGNPPNFGLAAGIAIAPNGSRAYVSSRWDSSGNALDSVIDTVPTSSTYNQVLATIGTGFHNTGQAIVVTPDGSRAYLTGLETTVACGTPPCNITTATGQTFTCNFTTCGFEALIEVANTATNTIDPTLTLLTGACGTTAIAITPDGTRAYVEDFLGVPSGGCVPQLDVINLATNTLVATVPLPGGGGGGSFGLAITPDGNHAFVTGSNQTDGLVLVVDTSPTSLTYNTIVATIDLGPSGSILPYGLAITPDGGSVYLAALNTGGIVGPESGFIDVIATATNTVVAQINLAASTRPTAVAITPAPAFSGGQLVFAPKSWDFGAIKLGTSATRKFNIANGSQTQELQVNVMPATPSPPYSLLSGGGSATIGAGQSEQIVVQFKPVAVTATPIAGSIPITSSDPNQPSASIPLSGRGK